jgi:hypothetical protein
MSKSALFTDQLARAYREARVLVLGDRTPKVDRAFALHREFLALRASLAEAGAGGLSDWETTFLERTRRAIIIALRHQAIAVRERWSESRGTLGLDQASPHFDLEHALQLSTAAMQLHTDRDPDAPRTAKVMEFIRQSGAQAGVAQPEMPRPQERPTVRVASETPAAAALPSIPAASAMPSNVDPADAPLHRTVPDDAPEPIAATEVVQTGPAGKRGTRAARLLPALTAAGFVVLIGAASLVLRVKTTPASDTPAAKGRPGNVAIGAPAPVRTQDPVRVTTVLLQSEPSGARVTVDGELRGTTPLSLEGKPGDVLTIVAQKDNRIWRGVLTVGSEGNQAVTVRLQQPKIAQTPRAQPTKASSSGHKRFDTVMREGIELYNKGWFGPAVGRFREAVSLDPRSPEANLWLARALIRSDRQAEARPILEKVIELARTGPQADEAAVLLSKL